MNDLAITGLLILTLFLILGSGVWIGLSIGKIHAETKIDRLRM